MQIRLTAVIILCCSAFIVSAQDKKKAPAKPKVEENILVKVENEAHTDLAAWQKYLLKHSLLLDSAWQKLPAGSYEAEVLFIVDKYGRLTDIKAEKDPGHGLGAYAVKIIRNYNGTWTPAIQCGRAVSAYKKQKITFEIVADN